MLNTVPLKKQRKRAQKEFHSKRRGSWYGISPVTRSVPSGKAYDRNLSLIHISEPTRP